MSQNDRLVVAGPDGPIEVVVSGTGPSVVLLASLGRGADDSLTVPPVWPCRLLRPGARTKGVGASVRS